jgi:hypothetical protein
MEDQFGGLVGCAREKGIEENATLAMNFLDERAYRELYQIALHILRNEHKVKTIDAADLLHESAIAKN